MQAVRVRHYIERATDFLNGMKLVRDDEEYRNSSALLAIHSAVSYTDALRSGLGHDQLSSDDRLSAADALRRLLPSGYSGDRKGLAHFEYLIAKKNWLLIKTFVSN